MIGPAYYMISPETLMKTRQKISGAQGVKLQVATYGDSSHTPLILVHGYPDNHQVWEGVARLLADRYFVIAYDVRGAGESDRPKRVRDYSLDILSQDLKAVADAIIPDRPFHLIGHDWGSIQSWESVTTDRLKGRILSFTSISGPSLDHAGQWMQKQLLHSGVKGKVKAARQLAKSWYIMLFQFPVIAPALWKLVMGKHWENYLAKAENIHNVIPNPTQTADGVHGTKLYKANFLGKLSQPRQRIAHCPVQLAVLLADNYMNVELFDDLHQSVPELYRRDFAATHWAPLSHPQEIARWVDEFITGLNTGKMPFDLVKI